jgi:hypothetical protein
MLRLTPTSDPTAVTLKAEGRIVAEWGDLLERECVARVARGERVRLDLGGVTYVDGVGVDVLRRLAPARIEIVNCRPLIGELLREEW